MHVFLNPLPLTLQTALSVYFITRECSITGPQLTHHFTLQWQDGRKCPTVGQGVKDWPFQQQVFVSRREATVTHTVTPPPPHTHRTNLDVSQSNTTKLWHHGWHDSKAGTAVEQLQATPEESDATVCVGMHVLHESSGQHCVCIGETKLAWSAWGRWVTRSNGSYIPVKTEE